MRVFKHLLMATFFVALGTFVLNGSSAKAETETVNQDTYSYTASQGDNLTYVVRDSIQQYVKANDKNINAAQRLYTETNVVNDMGAYWLDVDQNVQVSKAKVQEYVNNSESLDADTQKAWQVYADQTDVQAMIDGSQSAVMTNKQAAEEQAASQQKSSEQASNNNDKMKADEAKQNDEKMKADEAAKNAETSKTGFGQWFKENWTKLVLVALIASVIYRILTKKPKNTTS